MDTSSIPGYVTVSNRITNKNNEFTNYPHGQGDESSDENEHNPDKYYQESYNEFPIYVEISGKYTGYNTKHWIGWIQLVTLFCQMGFALWMIIVGSFVPVVNFWPPTIVIVTVLGILLTIHWGTLVMFYSKNIVNGTECMSHSFMIEIY